MHAIPADSKTLYFEIERGQHENQISRGKKLFLGLAYNYNKFRTNNYRILSDDGTVLVKSEDFFRGGLNSTATKIRIFIVKRNKKVEVNWDEAMKQELLTFIKTPHDSKYSCVSFAMNQASLLGDDPNIEWIANQHPLKLKSGALVACIDNEGLTKHFAFYLNNGLFLSVLGTGGPLAVTHLEEMHKYQRTEHIFRLFPSNGIMFRIGQLFQAIDYFIPG